jgi:hypothetical protein
MPHSKLKRSRACSSPDRAFGSGPKGSRFNSCQAHLLDQLVRGGLIGAQRLALTIRVACTFPARDAVGVRTNQPPALAAIRAFKQDVRCWAPKMEVRPRSITAVP